MGYLLRENHVNICWEVDVFTLFSLFSFIILLNRDMKQLVTSSFLTSISNRSGIFEVFFLKPFLH